MRVIFRLATTHPAPAGEDVTEHAWTFAVELEPLAIAPDGSVTMKVGILRVCEESSLRNRGKIHHFDTAEGAPEPSEHTAFLGESFTIVVSARGTPVKLDTDAFYTAIAEGRGKHEARAEQIWATFRDTNQLRTLLTNLLAPFAAQPVKPGDHWPGPVMLRLEGFMELAGTYTFKGLESGVCILQAEAHRSMDDQPIGPPPPQGAPRANLAGAYQATIKVDQATGSLLSQEAVMELKGTAPMPSARTRTFGDPVPIVTRATVTVEPVL